MSDEVIPPTPTPSALPYSAQAVQSFFHELRELGMEYVRASRWDEYDALLTVCFDTHAGASTAEELEDVAAKVSFASKDYLVEFNWQPYRKLLLLQLAPRFGLDPNNI